VEVTDKDRLTAREGPGDQRGWAPHDSTGATRAPGGGARHRSAVRSPEPGVV